MPAYLSTDPNAGLGDYLSTDPNAGLDEKKYLSTDPNAGDDYLKRVADSIKQSPKQELSPEEKARTGQIYAEPGAVTGGVKENDPFTGKTAGETPLLSSESIKKALSAIGEIGATEPVTADPVQDKINQAIADRLSGMTSEKFASTLPMY